MLTVLVTCCNGWCVIAKTITDSTSITKGKKDLTKPALFLYLRNGGSEVFFSQLCTFCTLLPLYTNPEHLGHMNICLSPCNIKCSAAPLPGQTPAGHQSTDVKRSHFYTRNLAEVLINRETVLIFFIWWSLKTLPLWGTYKWKLDAAFCPESEQLSAPSNVCFSFSFLILWSEKASWHYFHFYYFIKI